ncbi:MAG: ABC transporter permease [Gemmatimonadaceae bacterium]
METAAALTPRSPTADDDLLEPQYVPESSDDIDEPQRSALAEIVADYWSHRDLLYQLTLRDVRLRYKQAVMGFGWAILMPMLVVLSGLIVRFAMAYYAGTSLVADDVARMGVKGVGWAFFVGALGFATSSLVSNSNLVAKVYFPREVLPVSATLAQAVDSAIGSAALAVLLVVLGVHPTLALLWVPVLALLLFVFTTAVSLAVSCANLFFRDIKYIVQVVLTFGIFFTPVLFEPAAFGRRGAWMMLNPLSPLLEGLRLSVVEGHNLLAPLVVMSVKGERVLAWTPWYLAYAAVWSIGGLLLASLLFHKLESAFAEYV